jgi:hypothetical protein
MSDSETWQQQVGATRLVRLSRILLASGVLVLAAGLLIQWLAYTGRFGGLDGGATNGIVTAFIAQFLTVVGTVALTGAVFGFVLDAFQNDRDDREEDNGL